MIAAKAFGVFVTIAAAGTIGQATVPLPNPANNPALFDFIGYEVPILPVGVGVLTALLVRIVIITSSPHRLRSYNAAITLIAMLGTATFITDHQAGPGMSFWIGGGFGALGVGVIELAKSRLTGMLGVESDTKPTPPPLSDKPPA